MTNPTLERAARALMDRAGYTEYGPVVPASLAPGLARAVLMAVREPDERHFSPVRAAGQWKLVPHSAPVTMCVDANFKAQEVFTAMIDAILAEGE